MAQRSKMVDQDLSYKIETHDVRREASLEHAKQQKKLDKQIKK
jgi:adenosyl cobinamide kinase/adenosyl cobinamide phosphate guanylyltransferase